MADEIGLQILGLDELKATLAALPDKLRRRALRNALAAGARIVRDAAKAQAPQLNLGLPGNQSALQRGIRQAGTVRNAVRVRTSKDAKRQGNVGVFINIRPAKGAQRGAKRPSDPFYWRFLEFGTRKMRPQPFLRPAASALQAALVKFETTLGPQIQRLNVNPKDSL